MACPAKATDGAAGAAGADAPFFAFAENAAAAESVDVADTMDEVRAPTRVIVVDAPLAGRWMSDAIFISRCRRSSLRPATSISTILISSSSRAEALRRKSTASVTTAMSISHTPGILSHLGGQKHSRSARESPLIATLCMMSSSNSSAVCGGAGGEPSASGSAREAREASDAPLETQRS